MPKIDIENAPTGHGTGYPDPHAEHCLGRKRWKLGDAAGLDQFGVNLLRLSPGDWSSQRHWHQGEDEFCWVVQGEVVLVDDDGETTLRAGDCAGFKAGVPNGHKLENRSDREAVVLEVGTRMPGGDSGEYTDIDMTFGPLNGGGYRHRDGTPYPDQGAPREVIEPPPDPQPSDNPFRIHDFRLLWFARTAAVLAIQIQGATLLWQVYDVARDRHYSIQQSALYVSLVGLMQFLPLLALTLPAGEMADRRDRKSVMALCVAMEGVCAALFLGLTLHGHAPLWSLLAVAALFGASRAFLAPASQAMLPMLVPRVALPRAIVTSSLAFLLGSIAGPALAGPLIGISPWAAYAAALALFAIAALLIMAIRTPTQPEPQTGSRWALIKEGIGYVWNNKIVFGSISLDLAAVLLGGATLLVPIYARDILHVGPEGYGLMRAAFGVGALLITLLLWRWTITKNAGAWMFASVAVFGVATVVFGLSTWLWVSVAALFIAGAADMISVNIRQTLIQIATPDHMRGRVSSVSMLFIGASNELGEFESGLAARFLGPVGAAVFGGVGAVIACPLWAWWFPQLRKADKLV